MGKVLLLFYERRNMTHNKGTKSFASLNATLLPSRHLYKRYAQIKGSEE
jgi:hypothetical protein